MLRNGMNLLTGLNETRSIVTWLICQFAETAGPFQGETSLGNSVTKYDETGQLVKIKLWIVLTKWIKIVIGSLINRNTRTY